jgi:prepilin peptidase CpaA
MMIFSAVAILLFPLLMAFAASSDLLTMRISNVLVLVLVVSFFVLALVLQLPLEVVVQNLIVAGVTLVVGFVFFAFRWIGGGDAKLAAATMLWIGLGELLPYLVYAALLGGALTMAIIAIRRWPLPERLAQLKWLDRLHDSKSGVPYGIALAAAGILVYTDTAIFRHLAA